MTNHPFNPQHDFFFLLFIFSIPSNAIFHLQIKVNDVLYIATIGIEFNLVFNMEYPFFYIFNICCCVNK